ncbi:AMP-binding protein [Marinobacterium mangrovicola]|uniref:Long-chain-fatty-acid--CoA ligase n=1 Tax=Marinobacterium mangrovicola TaxID=1476959 RepID=A0A4R1GVL9_9GAMM|nr:AMP-binding protein [Marinobacterium mangrovicola]TCK08412.1 long-chain acyl-CoA synthetase [Marinobacterium mangrovicola]
MMGSINPYATSYSTLPAGLNRWAYANLVDFFERTCARYADKPAFTSFGRTLSYAELERLSASFAVYIQRHTDLSPGDRIAIQLPNLIQYPVVLFGALRAGLVVVNTNPLYTAEEMAHQFADSGARALVIHKSMAHKAEAILERTQLNHLFVTQVGDLHGFVKRTLLNAAIKYIKHLEPDFYLPGALGLRDVLLEHLGERPTPVKPGLHDLAVLQYTGGTTGVAKGAMLTQGNLLANLMQGYDFINSQGSGWAENVLLPLPLYHIYAFTVSQIIMASGGHCVLVANPRDIDSLVREIAHWPMTAFMGLNTLFNALCNRETFRQLDFSRLELTLSGGMALTRDAANRWEKVTGCPIMEAYGLTEASPAVAINPRHAIQPGTIGLALPHTEVKVVDEEGRQVADGVPGMLCVRGPQVMAGYWQREEETHETITDDGWLKTGDIAVQQSDGYLRIVDRAKDLIIVSGFNVYPNEVEDVVCAHPEVVECAAIGVPDPDSGERVKLFVVSNSASLDRAAIREWCRRHLTAYKVPREVELVTELPKSPVGKVIRRHLRDAPPAADTTGTTESRRSA